MGASIEKILVYDCGEYEDTWRRTDKIELTWGRRGHTNTVFVKMEMECTIIEIKEASIVVETDVHGSAFIYEVAIDNIIKIR